MTIYLGTQVRTAILSLRNGIGIECACLYYVGTCGKIFCVYLAYDIGAGKHQQVIVALERTGMSRKQRAAEITLAKGVFLYHGTHGSIENQNTFLYCICQGCFHLVFCFNGKRANLQFPVFIFQLSVFTLLKAFYSTPQDRVKQSEIPSYAVNLALVIAFLD